jgi:hypothetical protein
MKRFLLLPGLCLGSLLSAADATTTYTGTWDDPAWGKGDLTTIVGGEVKEKPGKLKVVFKLKWEDNPTEYTGWMTPADKDGKIDGWVDAGGDMYTYVFKGTLKDGVLKADHYNVSDEATKCGNFEGKLAKDDKGAKDKPAKKDGEAKPKKAVKKTNEDGKAPEEKAPGE